MSKKSASTYIALASVAGDLAKTIAAAQSEAATRLGGADGLTCTVANLLGDGSVGMTWLRAWDEPDPAAPAEEPAAPAEPAAALEA